MDGAQWQTGLGKYIFNEKGYKKIATVGEDYSFVYTQVFGFVLEYCAAGCQVTNRQWVPLGTKDFGSVIAALPDDVDAIYLGLGGGDAINFLNQYQQAGGKAHLIGGSIMVDQTILSAKGNAKNALLGKVAASGQGDTWDDPRWQAFVKAYQDAFPPEKRFPSPSLLATNYYGAALAMMEGLAKVNADLSDGHAKFRATLASLEIDAPNGKTKLDSNRQAIGTNFVTEVIDDGKGTLYSKVESFPTSIKLWDTTQPCLPKSDCQAELFRNAKSTKSCGTAGRENIRLPHDNGTVWDSFQGLGFHKGGQRQVVWEEWDEQGG